MIAFILAGVYMGFALGWLIATLRHNASKTTVITSRPPLYDVEADGGL